MENVSIKSFAELENSVYAALETYSNVHRGSGHNSITTTRLFDQARDIVLEYLGLSKSKYVVIFCTARRAAIIKSKIKSGSYKCLSAADTGLPLGVWAVAAEKKALPEGAPFETGGGTTRLVAPGWILWAGTPDRFEAGTPAIVNVIAFAKALQLIRQYGPNAFMSVTADKTTAADILHHDELEAYSGRKLLEELKKTLIGRGKQVPTKKGPRPFINFDYGASTPAFEPVWSAAFKTWQQNGETRQEIVREVRSIIAGFIGASATSYDLIFTSNTTEAINLAAESLGREHSEDTETVILNTILEHNSNDLPWRHVPGASLIRMKADSEGFLDMNELDRTMSAYNLEKTCGKQRIRLVAVSGASNVVGTFNNLEEISRIVHRYGARLLVDAAQLVAHRRIEMEKWGIDYLAFSAHKVYAPFGTGVLAVRKGLLQFSAEELELINLSGEENSGGIAALGKSLALLQRIGMDVVVEEEQALTRRALNGLLKIESIKVLGITDADSANFRHKGGVFVFRMDGAMPNVIAKRLSEHGGIGVRYGCHCSHLLVKNLLGVGPGLERFQKVLLTVLPKVRLPGLLRVSMGIGNSEDDVDTLISVLEEIGRGKRKKG